MSKKLRRLRRSKKLTVVPKSKLCPLVKRMETLLELFSMMLTFLRKLEEELTLLLLLVKTMKSFSKNPTTHPVMPMHLLSSFKMLQTPLQELLLSQLLKMKAPRNFLRPPKTFSSAWDPKKSQSSRSAKDGCSWESQPQNNSSRREEVKFPQV